MLIDANAKINLALSVTGIKDDHYHTLDMIDLPLRLHDMIDISIMPFEKNDSYITCDDPIIPIDEYNLAVIALKKMREHFKFKQQFRIQIHKAIPSEAGLGGGSADAAGVIKGIVKLLGLKPTNDELMKIGLEVGADVPFLLFNKPARVQGIGEIITPITVKNKYDVLLIKPNAGCSTKDVFKNYDNEKKTSINIDAIIDSLSAGDDKALGELIANDLEVNAIEVCPEIEKIMTTLKKYDNIMVGMSGSGSTVFAVSVHHHLL